MKPIDSIWFNNKFGSFGFVLGEDEATGKRAIYAGVAGCVDQKADEIMILQWGNKVNLNMMKALLEKAEKKPEEI